MTDKIAAALVRGMNIHGKQLDSEALCGKFAGIQQT